MLELEEVRVGGGVGALGDQEAGGEWLEERNPRHQETGARISMCGHVL